jgi:hypothetical protein
MMTSQFEDNDFIVILDAYTQFYRIYNKYKLKIFINNLKQYKHYTIILNKFKIKNIIDNLKNIKVSNLVAQEVSQIFCNIDLEIIGTKIDINKFNNNYKLEQYNKLQKIIEMNYNRSILLNFKENTIKYNKCKLLINNLKENIADNIEENNKIQVAQQILLEDLVNVNNNTNNKKRKDILRENVEFEQDIYNFDNNCKKKKTTQYDIENGLPKEKKSDDFTITCCRCIRYVSKVVRYYCNRLCGFLKSIFI